MVRTEKRTIAGLLKKQPIPDFMVELDCTLPSVWICDNRVSLQVGREGQLQLTYTGRADNTSGILSNHNNDFFECLRPSIRVGDLNYVAEEGRLVVGPFGLFREQRFPREKFGVRTGIWMAEDCCIFAFDLFSKARTEAWGEVVIWPQCFELHNGRTWDGWEAQRNVISRVGRERRGNGKMVQTCLAVSGGRGIEMREYREPHDIHCSGKFRFATALAPRRTAFLVVAIGNDPQEAKSRAVRVARKAEAVLARQFERYQRLADKLPELECRSAMLKRFMHIAPLYHEALKKPDTPGVSGCKTVGNWMWLWDAALPDMIRPYFGDAAHSAEAARLHGRFLHPRLGLPVAYPVSMITYDDAPPRDQGDYRYEVQCLWQILVHDVAALTGDRTLIRELYDKMRSHFVTMLGSTAGDSGLLKGVCLFPDARALMDETDNTVSAYNNACWYNGCRKMERLALEMDDPETACLARRTALAIEKSFWPTFWNKKQGYLSASAGSDLRPQDVFATTATFWDFGFGDELCDGYQRRIVEYQLRHFYSRMCITIVSPHHRRHWDRDGNQFHCSWPVMDSHNLKLAVWARKGKALAHFLPWLESMISRHSMSEAIQARVCKDAPVIYDQGSWYGYSSSSWYRVVVECLLGVTLDEGGVTLAGSPAEPMTLRGLHYRGARLDIVTRGRGWNIASLALDGRKIVGTQKIAADLLQGRRHRIVVTRTTATPPPWRVMAANGSSVQVVRANPNDLAFRLGGVGLSRALLYAPGLRRVTIEGVSYAFRKSERPGCFWIETVLNRAGDRRLVEASARAGN